MSEFSAGGYVPGRSTMLVTREGICAQGHALIRCDNGPVEHIVTPEQMRRGDFSAITCRSLG